MRNAYRGQRLLLAAFTVWACESGGPGERGPSVRDSAGVRVVENGAAGVGLAEWLVGTDPILKIGALEGEPEYQLHEVSGAARLSDGRIVIASEGSNDLRFYSSEGVFLHSVGGAGGGPGEFRRLAALTLLSGDSLLAYDRDLGRVSYFNAEGEFLHSVNLQPPPMTSIRDLAGRLGEGSVLATAVAMRGEEVEEGVVVRDDLMYLRYSETGQLVDTLASFPGQERTVGTFGGMAMSGDLPAGRSTLHAVHGDRLFVGDNDTYEVRVLSPDGSVEQIVRKEYEPVSIDRSRIDRFLDSTLATDIDDDELRSAVRRMYDAAPFPETLPAFTALAVDIDGNLWAREGATFDSESNRWTVFAGDGLMIAAVELPPRLRPHQIGADFVLGRWTDELGIEYVRMYGLRKR